MIRRLPRLFSRAALLGVLATLGALAGVATPRPAYAQGDVQARLDRALDQATDDYDILEIQSAEKKLEDAIELAKKNDVSGPTLGKLYVMLGVVRLASTRDEALAHEAFVSALKADAKAAIPDVYVTPTLSQIMSDARTEVGPSTAEKPDEGKQQHKKIDGLTHTPIQTADAGKKLQFEVFVPQDMPVFRMFLYHRRYGEDDYQRMELEPTSATRFAADLPGKFVHTSQIDYYIEGVDRGGDVIARSGDDLNPHEIVVLGSGDEKNGDVIVHEKDHDHGTKTLPSGERTWIYASLLGGTDVGFLPGGTPTANPGRNVSPGVAPAFGHAVLDVGSTLTDKMYLGLYFRFQFAPYQNFDNLQNSVSTDPGHGFWDTKRQCLGLGLPGDCMLGLKYKLFFSNSESFRMYSSLGAGVGRVRNWLRLKQATESESEPGPLCKGKPLHIDDASGKQYCYIRDTVRTGWLHFGLGGGVAFPVAPHTALTLDSYFMVLVPETSVNLDVSGGLTFRF